jgi:hypothetical protein
VPSPTVEATPTPIPPVVFEGSGNQATDLFSIPSGLTWFDFEYVGESNFIVYLLDENGDEDELLANELGSVTSNKALLLEEPAMHSLNITARGTWKIVMRASTQEEIDSAPTAPTTVTGSGNRTFFINIPTGRTQFEFSHTGERNFIVYLITGPGSQVLVANELGVATGSKVMSIDSGGLFLMEVSGDGSWEIHINE